MTAENVFGDNPGTDSPGTESLFHFKFLGAFCLTGPDGRRIHIRSKKGVALLALLATAERGERSRAWLQEKLWGSRELPQAQSSLRRELASLRSHLNGVGRELVEADFQTIRLNLELAAIDVRGDLPRDEDGEFLEGLDLPGQQAFLEWRREMRNSLALRRHESPVAATGIGETASPPARQPTLALAVMPIEREGEAAAASASPLCGEVAHLLVKCLTARQWLPILVPPNLVACRVEDGTVDPVVHSARYVLEGRIFFAAAATRLVLDLKARPDSRLLWTETLSVTEAVAAGTLDESIGRLCNGVSHAAFYAELRRIRSLPRKELSADELTHLTSHHLTQMSVEHIAMARVDLDNAIQAGGWDATRVILDAHVNAMSFMASDYTEIDHVGLRKWASQAMSADPTDWRGPMLASMVELWLGNPSPAITHAHTAENLCPANSSIMGQLGMAYLWNGQPELAVAELDAALGLSLLDRRPYLILCNLALAHLMLNQHGQALAFCEQAATCVPELGFAYLIKLAVLIRLDRHHDAAQVYRESVCGRFEDLMAVVRHQRIAPPAQIPLLQEALELAAAAAARLDRKPSANG